MMPLSLNTQGSCSKCPLLDHVYLKKTKKYFWLSKKD